MRHAAVCCYDGNRMSGRGPQGVVEAALYGNRHHTRPDFLSLWRRVRRAGKRMGLCAGLGEAQEKECTCVSGGWITTHG